MCIKKLIFIISVLSINMNVDNAYGNLYNDEFYQENFSVGKEYKLIKEFDKSKENNKNFIALNLFSKYGENKINIDTFLSPKKWNEVIDFNTDFLQKNNSYILVIDYKVLKKEKAAFFYIGNIYFADCEPKQQIQKFKKSPKETGRIITEIKFVDCNKKPEIKFGVNGNAIIDITDAKIYEKKNANINEIAKRKKYKKNKSDLIWRDEFKDESLNIDKWTVTGPKLRRRGIWHPENVYIKDKEYLTIETNYDGTHYKSAEVTSKRRFKYGYFEAKIKLHESKGHWFAFWLFSKDVLNIGNQGTDGTEIDIIESPYLDKGKLNLALHWDGYGEQHQRARKTIEIKKEIATWNIYALDWSEFGYIFYINDVEVWRTDAGGGSKVPLNIKFSDEIGIWAGDITTEKLPDRTLIDYIRVYRTTSTEAEPTRNTLSNMN